MENTSKGRILRTEDFDEVEDIFDDFDYEDFDGSEDDRDDSLPAKQECYYLQAKEVAHSLSMES